MHGENTVAEPNKSGVIDKIVGSAKRMDLLHTLLPMALLGGGAGLITGLRKAKLDADALKSYGPAELKKGFNVAGDKLHEYLGGSKPNINIVKVNKLDKPLFGKVRSANVDVVYQNEPKIKTPQEELKFKAKSVASSVGLGTAEATVTGAVTEYFRTWGAGDRSKAAMEDSLSLMKLAASNKAKRALIDAEIQVRYADAIGKVADELRNEMENDKGYLSPEVEARLSGFRI